MIQITSNRKEWLRGGLATANVMKLKQVERIVRRGLTQATHRMNKAQIDGGGIGRSGAYPPLAASTIKRKGHSRFLYDSGRLYRKATRGGNIQAGYITGFRVFLYKFVIKSIPEGLVNWLQKGTSRMPARPIVDPTRRQLQPFNRVMASALVAGFKAIGWADKVGRPKIRGFEKIDIVER